MPAGTSVQVRTASGVLTGTLLRPLSDASADHAWIYLRIDGKVTAIPARNIHYVMKR